MPHYKLNALLIQVTEISRVLKPGGVFVASTILNPSSGLGSFVGDENLRPFKQVCFWRWIPRVLSRARGRLCKARLLSICSRGCSGL